VAVDQEKFSFYVDSIRNAFEQVARKMTGLSFTESDKTENLGADTISVIIGICGQNKGRIMFEAGHGIAKIIGDKVYGDDCGTLLELYLSLGEFTNTFGGVAISAINNQYRGTQLRLTPPAVFGGEEMEIITPNIRSAVIYCNGDSGSIRLDIGFEGA
jgi:CheY-specific phosphatase CheX